MLEQRLLSNKDSGKGRRFPNREKARLRMYRKMIRRAETDIRRTEKELENASRLDPVSEELTYLGVIRGNNILYEVRSRVVLIGRATPDSPVDVDLSLEGDARKVSRRAALLEFKHDGNFHLKNLSSRPILVNGCPVAPDVRCRLPLDSPLIQIGGISVLLAVNKPLYHRIQHELG